ncbi:MAG: YraN family protein [Deltaproteobacteria bacterium]|nr:YraN family protein [Deltaproteobacteria bacterium]
MDLSRIIFGRAGEEEAERELKKRGYRVIEKNYRCRFGEIDLVARDGKTLVFVEVKTRANANFGTPQCGVNLKKQRHITMASSCYMAEKGIDDIDVRFDVVSVFKTGDRLSAEVIKDAFEAIEL